MKKQRNELKNRVCRTCNQAIITDAKGIIGHQAACNRDLDSARASMRQAEKEAEDRFEVAIIRAEG